jgi:glucose uptake protein
MILPHDPTTLMYLMILSLVCLGSWANFYKLAGKWRFELFCFDFALGLLAVALILALTAGNLGFDGFNFRDDLMNAGKRQWLFGFLGAVIFNFANMLMIAAVSVAGIALTFPVGFGVAFIVGSAMSYATGPGVSPAYLFGGCGLLALAVILNCSAYSRLGVLKHENQARAGTARSTRRPSAMQGIILAMVGGVLMGCFAPLLGKAQSTENGLGPYSLMAIFGLAVVFSTFVCNLFFMNLPIEGDPLEFSDYFKGSVRQHAMGAIGGGLWALGATAALVVATAKGDTHLPQMTFDLLSKSAPLLAALFGLLVWREYKGGDPRVKLSTVLMLLVFAGGVAAISLASFYTRT